MKEKKYLTAGQFAKICGVEKHVFVHYDGDRALSAVMVNENGYRYYPIINTIPFPSSPS